MTSVTRIIQLWKVFVLQLVLIKLFVQVAQGAPINLNNNLQELNDANVLSFGYEVEDPETNNVQFRTENRYPNGTVKGSYGYLELDGNIHIVHYVADENGYRATIEDSLRRGESTPILDSDYFAYGISQQMLAALNSLQRNPGWFPQDQRLRPFDQQNEEQKLQYVRQKGHKIDEPNQSLVKARGNVFTIDNNFDQYLNNQVISNNRENEEQTRQELGKTLHKMDEGYQKLSKSDGDVLTINNFDQYIGGFRETEDEVPDDDKVYDFQYFV